MKKFLKNNSLSIVFFLLFIGTIIGQVFTGWKEHNQEREDDGMPLLSLSQYISSGHFLQATFENWESEFLQMALFVVLTASLYQKGSSESKDPDKKEEVDRKPSARRKNVPWPVRRGGMILWIYSRSLSIVLFILFFLSIIVHFHGSLQDENEKLAHKGLPPETISEYLGSNRFWFESFQNWQSEFLSVFAIVVLSIYFRQLGSSQSKPVDAPDEDTGS